MKERPILFKGPMVIAIDENRKTQTRRIVKRNASGRVELKHRQWHIEDADAILACPWGQPRDRLWIRETWATDEPEKLKLEEWEGGENPSWIIHRAHRDNIHEDIGIRWRPSIFMRRWMARITLEIVAVRVERLQDISEADAKAEGVTPKWPDGKPITHDGSGSVCREAFEHLWKSINGPNSWSANPFVWVVEFKKITP